MSGRLIGAEPQADPIKTSLENLKQTGSSVALKPALASIDEKNAKVSTQKKIEAYIDFMNQIMAIYDPQFDTNPPELFLNLMPGPGPVPGRGLTAGMDPKDIPDKAIREAYERAIAENAKNIKHTNIQKTLRKTLEDLARKYSAALKAHDLSDTERADAVEKIRKTTLPTALKDKFIPEQEGVKPQPPSGETSK